MSLVKGKYEIVIGIETHVQLATKTKLFCGCDNDAREAEPNTKVCPVCLGMPGTLPVLNERAVMLALRTGLALGAKINRRTMFDRKNYFYPDLPKGYQITQFDDPIVGEGKLEVPMGDDSFTVGITRAHMEEDAGKLTHPAGADYSLVDLNRAGTPLLEIVSEPDMRSAAQAKAYATELYNVISYAGVSNANLYYGNMRFDVNVSLHEPGTEFGTRSETKNLNSFKAVERTVEYEAKRQAELLEKGETVVQETRGWDEAKQRTVSQRSKEDAHDYRYFPEPDVPPIVITDRMMEQAQGELPPLPVELRQRLASLGIAAADVETLIGEPLLIEKLLEAVHQDETHAKRIAGWLVNEGIWSEEAWPEVDHDAILPNPSKLVELASMVDKNELSSTNAKVIFRELYVRDTQPRQFAEVNNLLQNSDSDALAKIVEQVLVDNPTVVEEYKAGKEQVLGFLVGQVMKASRGQANPGLAGELLKKALA